MTTDEAQPARRPPLSFFVGPHELLWPDPERGPWLVRATFGKVGEATEVVGLSVRSLGAPDLEERFRHAPPLEEGLPLPLTTEVWRALPVGRLMAQMKAGTKKALHEAGLLEGRPGSAARWTAPRRRDGVDLARVAEVYLEAQRAGCHPTEAVRTELGPMSKSAAAQRVSRARQAGLLGPTTRGRSSGAPARPEAGRSD